jgi:hypothetical protein
MGVSRVINRRTAVLGLLLVILATAGFGFAASNTVDQSSAGDGSTAISGYDIENIDYTLAGDPTLLSSVSFDLNGGVGDPDVGEVKVQLNSLVPGQWFDCTGGGVGTVYTCAINGSVTVAAADIFRVVAVQ